MRQASLHESAKFNVTIDVTIRFVWALAALLPPVISTAAPPTDLPKLLKSVEKRYNSARTLQVGFAESYTAQGRTRTESGDLFLRKPGRMRWQYARPAGKLFVSDGKTVYFYSPETKRAEKMKLKETEDMRAPLAFLLGRLDFSRDFGQYRTQAEGSNTRVVAIPKSDKLDYREVTFVVAPDFRIERLIVTRQDSSVLDFTFTGEKVNPAISDQLFRFELPPGAEFVDSSQSGQGAQ